MAIYQERKDTLCALLIIFMPESWQRFNSVAQRAT